MVGRRINVNWSSTFDLVSRNQPSHSFVYEMFGLSSSYVRFDNLWEMLAEAQRYAREMQVAILSMDEPERTLGFCTNLSMFDANYRHWWVYLTRYKETRLARERPIGSEFTEEQAEKVQSWMRTEKGRKLVAKSLGGASI